MGKVVGIDLGTTNSVVAVMEGGKPVVIANSEGMRTTPSVVAFSKEGEKLIGQMARRQSVLNPQNTFYAVKRFVGRRYDELSSESKRVPYTVRRSESGTVKIKCPKLAKEFAPEEISAMILRKLAEEASQYLGQPVTGAVITVPAYFNDAQRQATRDAGRIAGLEVKRIINEPTAASLAYGLDQQYNQTILVFDLGGGTFDVSVLDVGDGVFEVRSTSGDTQLGGLNFDKKIVDWLAEEFLAKEGVDLRRDRQSLQRLSEAAEKAKIELSGVPVTAINLPFITATADGPKHIETKLDRSHFEALCSDLVSRIRGPLQQALADANVSPSQVDEVVLVGGSSRIPMVQDLVRSIMNREPNRNVNPDEVVAVGAAIQAGILTQEIKDILLLDVSPLSLGVETIGGVMKKLIPRNTTIPVRRSDTFSTSENNQTVVEVHIMQGEREMAQDNKSLGRFKLMGIPPAPRGIPQVQVSFDIDANGILQVSALDKTTGRQQSITVQEASNLSEADIQTMIRDAEENSATDRLLRERIEKKNRAGALTFKAERVLREVAIDFGMQFARDRRRRIEGLVQELRVALEQNDERGIDIAQSDLQNEVYELNREAYLYDIDEDGDGILGQIGSTLKKAFAGEDDDYYRPEDYGYGGGSGYSGYPTNNGNSWERQAQWDTPSWSRSNSLSQSSSWDDWDDDWDNPRNAPPAPNYTQGSNYQGSNYQGSSYQDSYQAPTYGSDGSINRAQPPRNGYASDPYGRDQGYEPPAPRGDSYSRNAGYGQTPPGQSSYTQGYDQSNYGQNQNQGSGQSSYGQSNYGQSNYGQSSPYNPEQGYTSQNSSSQNSYRQDAYNQASDRSNEYRQENYYRQEDDYARNSKRRQETTADFGNNQTYGNQNFAGQNDNDRQGQNGGYRQNDDAANGYGQNNYGQSSYGTESYRPDSYGSDSYSSNSYNSNSYGSNNDRQSSPAGEAPYYPDPATARDSRTGQGGYSESGSAQPYGSASNRAPERTGEQGSYDRNRVKPKKDSWSDDSEWF